MSNLEGWSGRRAQGLFQNSSASLYTLDHFAYWLNITFCIHLLFVSAEHWYG